MELIPTAIPDVLVIQPEVFGDSRGFFMETYQEQRYFEAGIRVRFVQDNHSGSKQGTLRGLHYQVRQAQGKLVRVVSGEIFDVAVDLRRRSPTFGKWAGVTLSADNRLQSWIPAGFAHGFYVTSAWAEVIYKASDYYAPQWERTLLWSDTDIGIQWPLLDGMPPVVSVKDGGGNRFCEAETYE
jgi:dTDP-4-dehydrorhamnose 3,5-epimerase